MSSSKKFEVLYASGRGRAEVITYWADRMEATGAGVAFYNTTHRTQGNISGSENKLVALIAPGWDSVKEVPLTSSEKAYEEAIRVAQESSLKHNQLIADARKAVEDERGAR